MPSMKTLIVSLSSLAAMASANAIRYYSANSCSGAVFSGCENIGANVCCTTNPAKWAVSISKGPLDVAVGWFDDGTNDCGDSVCTGGGSGTLCCIGSGVVPGYTGGSFYTIRNKVRSPAEVQKCTSTQEANVFGITIAEGLHLKIGDSEAAAQDASFSDLHAAFQKVAEKDAQAWLQKNGAVLETDEPITQTIQGIKAEK